jgi:hypothetical protein
VDERVGAGSSGALEQAAPAAAEGAADGAGLAVGTVDRRLAPESGPLAPVAHGWILRRVERARMWRLLPPGPRGALVGTATASAAGVGLALLVGQQSPALFPWAFAAAVVPLLFAPLLAERRLERLLADERALARALATCRRGDVVKVRGRVRPGPTFESAGLRRASVLASYAGRVAYATGALTDGVEWPWFETRGIDFTLDLASGETALVRVRDLYLMPHPPETRSLFWSAALRMLPSPLRRLGRSLGQGAVNETILGETNLGPGDAVEVLGVLDHEVSSAADAAGRGARLVPVLRAGTLTPLLVRRCSDRDAG